jgi:hypothetical protein
MEPDDEERFGLEGTFEENLAKLLKVDPESVADGEEEPEQDV